MRIPRRVKQAILGFAFPVGFEMALGATASTVSYAALGRFSVYRVETMAENQHAATGCNVSTSGDLAESRR